MLTVHTSVMQCLPACRKLLGSRMSTATTCSLRYDRLPCIHAHLFGMRATPAHASMHAAVLFLAVTQLVSVSSSMHMRVGTAPCVCARQPCHSEPTPVCPPSRQQHFHYSLQSRFGSASCCNAGAVQQCIMQGSYCVSVSHAACSSDVFTHAASV